MKVLRLSLFKRVAFYVALIIIWELIYKIGVEYLSIWKPYSFSSPIQVFRVLIDMVMDKTLLIAIISSIYRMIIGYSISLIIGMVVGLVIVNFRYIDENLSPIILGLQTLPNVCWLPFAILWYGLNEKAIFFIIAIGSTFAITIAVEAGIKNINPIYIKSAKTMGAIGIKMYLYVILPAALPSIINGMKQGWSFAWRALIAGEMFVACGGLGQILMIGRDISDISSIMATMLVIILLGIAFDKLIFAKIEYSIRCRWGFDRN